MPVQLNVLAAHYEISRANLTKSLLVFLLRGEYIAQFAGNYWHKRRNKGVNAGES